jgi:CheY-like chemotaxis protein
VEGRRVRLQIRHLIREMVGIARETFPRDIRIQEKVDRDVWPIVADATQIHQILLNLCVNARDAMPDGGELRIEARNVTLEAEEARRMPRAHPGPHVLLCVHDSGMGIAKENIDRIFEPFFTTKELGKGTGLGLSTVLGILRSHGGTVSVYSEPGRGTVFNIYLPADPEGGETAGADGEHERLTRGHGQTILVVDDEEPMRLVAKRALESNGYKVITAPNGQEAMRLFILNQSEIRLVLTDMMMPVMDGLKLARALRVLDEQLPILASSGLDFAEKTKGMEEGLIMDFLSKPYDVPILLKVIQQQLSSDHKG